MKLNTITLADTIEFLWSLPAASVDMLFADLPYGTTECSWDILIPFSSLWPAVQHAVKPQAPMVFTASQPFTSLLTVSNLQQFRYEWMWSKSRVTRHLDAARMPLKAHESVLVFDIAGHSYYPQMWWSGKKKSSKGGECQIYGKNTAKEYSSDGWRYPTSVLNFSMPDAERGLHPSQKPLSLMRYLIQTYSKPGDLICDPCAGSGSTLVAAAGLNRNFIGCDNDPESVAIATRRLAETDSFQDRKIDAGIQHSLFSQSL